MENQATQQAIIKSGITDPDKLEKYKASNIFRVEVQSILSVLRMKNRTVKGFKFLNPME